MPKLPADIAVQRLLAAYDGNSEAAIAAIKKAVEVQPARKSQKLPTTPVLIEAKDIAKSFKVGKQHITALQNVSLQIHEGEFVAITGSSGSGKSTLLQLLGGLDKPSQGSITIAGRDIHSMHDRELSRFRGQTIGFVFQFFYLQPFLSLKRNLEVPGMFAREKGAERTTRVTELAETVGLSERLDHFPSELSGGQIQRAAIARALFNNPKVLLADEPTGNLDSTNSTAIIAMFRKICTDFGTTIVLVTHDQAAARAADRVITIKDGVIA